MTSDQWLRVKQLFDAALERDRHERPAFLAATCDEPALRTEVERLLAAHDRAHSFIESSRTAFSLTGVVMGRYEVGRLLGTGGMGEVYAATDLELRRPVAVKIGLASDVDAHARLKREAQHASRLNHPNICTVHEVGWHHDRPFIVMELVEGRSLCDIVPSGGLPVEEVIALGSQVAEGLDHAHRQGVMHRDLKSANVLVTDDGRVKILDFGLARGVESERLKNLTESHTALPSGHLMAGTLSCMPPEVLRGEPGDRRSDIWALGILLYEMAAGERPFRGKTGFELSAAIFHATPNPLPSRFPEVFARIVSRCLEKDPGTRYQAADEVRAALCLVGAEARPRRRESRIPPRYSIGALATAALVATGAYLSIAVRKAPVGVGASGRPAIAVMHFDAAGADDDKSAWLANGVPRMLLTDLAQTRDLEVVSMSRLQEALAQGGGGSLGALDRTAAADVARRAGAGAIVVGSIFQSGGQIRIDAQVEDLASGRVVASKTVRGADVFALADRLAAEIRDAVGVPNGEGSRTVTSVSTTSIEAYLRLARASNALGKRSERRESLEHALEHVDRLSERQRLLLQIQIARDQGDLAAAARGLETAVARFPDLDDVYPAAAQIYRHVVGRPDNANYLAIMKAGVTALPSSPITRNGYGYALLESGRYNEAVAEFQTYASLAPREPNPYDSMGEAYLKMGDAQKAEISFMRAFDIDPTFQPARNMRGWILAVLGRYDEALQQKQGRAEFGGMILSRLGRYREGEQIIASGEAELAATDPNRASDLRLLLALLALERRDPVGALRHIQLAERYAPQLASGHRGHTAVLTHLLAGLAELSAARVDAAQAHFDSQRRLDDASSVVGNSWVRSLEAEIALARGDLDRAAALFSASPPPLRVFDPDLVLSSILLNDLPTRDGLARVAVRRGDVDGAIKVYRMLLTYGPESKWIAPMEPRYVLELARLEEKAGNRRAALAGYQRFLTLWKDADRSLPELAEARRAVVRLND